MQPCNCAWGGFPPFRFRTGLQHGKIVFWSICIFFATYVVPLEPSRTRYNAHNKKDNTKCQSVPWMCVRFVAPWLENIAVSVERCFVVEIMNSVSGKAQRNASGLRCWQSYLGKTCILYFTYPCTSVTVPNKHQQMHSEILLNHRFVNTVWNYNMFQPLKGHLQVV